MTCHTLGVEATLPADCPRTVSVWGTPAETRLIQPSMLDCKETPRLVDALESSSTDVLEPKSTADGSLLDCGARNDLARSDFTHDSCRKVHSKAADVVPTALDFANMDSCAPFQPEIAGSAPKFEGSQKGRPCSGAGHLVSNAS